MQAHDMISLQKPFINSNKLHIEQLDGSTVIQTHQHTHTRIFILCCEWLEFDSRVVVHSIILYAKSKGEKQKKNNKLTKRE